MGDNIKWHNGEVDYIDRCRLLNQEGIVIWLTGLSGSGKSTIAVELERFLFSNNKLSYRLDGDNIRHGLNGDLGFSLSDRMENIRRIAETAKLFADSGIITIVSFITPLNEMRDMARKIIGEKYREVYIKCDVNECMKRDPKGLYKKAAAGEIKDFTGISSPFDEPDNPELIIDTGLLDVNEAVDKIYNAMI